MTVTESMLPHAEAALQLLESLRALQTTVPGFDIPPTPLGPQARLRGHRLLPDAFFDWLAMALESSAPLASAIPLKPEEIRDMRRFGEAYLPVADDLERFARGIRYAVAKRRADVGRRASSAYKVAQAMNLLVDVSPLVPEVESMKRAIMRRRRNNAADSQPDTPDENAPERAS